MSKMRKILAGLLAIAMVGTLAACAEKTEEKAAGGTTAATTTTAAAKADDAAADTAADTTAAETEAGASTEKIKLKMSWWGGDSRHEATQAAIKRYEELNPNVEVEPQFSAWTGWEDTMSTAFYAGTAPDINQINWNWITSFSSDGSIFVDMNTLGEYFDLSQYSESALAQCTTAGKLQGIPVAMTGRIFYWNANVFAKAGIAVPTTYAELKAAGETFKTALGDEYYPLVIGEYDRMILMVYYLESVYGKAWVENGALNYTKEEIEAGLNFINELEDSHVIPTIATIDGDGAESLDKNPKWIDGYYGGIFEWDSSATKFRKALADNTGFTVGNYFADFGQYQGGYSKVSLCFAISETSKYPEECAKLLNFLLNEDEGTTLMASERGIPLSRAALANCTANKLLDESVAEANAKVLSWVSYPLDTKFEDSKLKGDPDGYYYEAMAALSYDQYSVSDAAQCLVDGINEVLQG